MTYHYVINDVYDYADEFDYPVTSSMTEDERTMLLDTYDIWKETDFDEIYFGTNEWLSFHHSDILKMIKNAEKLDETEYKYFQRFSTSASVDVVDRVMDSLYDHFGDKVYETIDRLGWTVAKAQHPEYFI